MIYHKSVTGGCCRVTATLARWHLRTCPSVCPVMFTRSLHSQCGSVRGWCVDVDDKRIRLEVVRLLMHVTRRSIQSLANELGCTRTHLSLVLNGKRTLTWWMSIRCLDAIQFDTREADEMVGVAGFITQNA